MILDLDLPQPDALLSPNARIHWAKRAWLVSNARAVANLTAKSLLANEPQPWITAPVVITGYVLWGPGRRKVDEDNLVAMLKPTLDGLQGVVYANDRQLVGPPRITQGRTHDPGGLLHLTIRDAWHEEVGTQ